MKRGIFVLFILCFFISFTSAQEFVSEEQVGGAVCSSGLSQASLVKDGTNDDLYHCSKKSTFTTDGSFVSDSFLQVDNSVCIRGEKQGEFADFYGKIVTLCVVRGSSSSSDGLSIDSKFSSEGCSSGYAERGYFTSAGGVKINYCMKKQGLDSNGCVDSDSVTTLSSDGVFPADDPSFLVGGYTTFNGAGSVKDVCSSGKIREAYCSATGAGSFLGDLQNCPQGYSCRDDEAGARCVVGESEQTSDVIDEDVEETVVTGSGKCEDDDDAQSSMVFGTCTDKEGEEFPDKCSSSSDTQVIQYRCGSGGNCLEVRTVTCPLGKSCRDGICVGSGSGECVDYDDGVNLDVKSYVVDKNGRRLDDSCSDNGKVKEAICDENDLAKTYAPHFACPSGKTCDGGKCVGGGAFPFLEPNVLIGAGIGALVAGIAASFFLGGGLPIMIGAVIVGGMIGGAIGGGALEDLGIIPRSSDNAADETKEIIIQLKESGRRIPISGAEIEIKKNGVSAGEIIEGESAWRLKFGGLKIGENYNISITKEGYRDFRGDFIVSRGDGIYTFNLRKMPTTNTNNIIASCTDTDEGLDYFVKGTVSPANGSASYSDICQNSDSLKEGSCTIFTKDILCSSLGDYTCQNGACVVLVAGLCTDTDNGKDVSVKGTATDNSGSFVDSCYTANKIYEQYCTTFGAKNTQIMDCPSGQTCSDGVCVVSGAY